MPHTTPPLRTRVPRTALAAPAGAPATGAADILALGFVTTVAMWGCGFFARLPGISLPTWLTFALLLACLVGGGVLAGVFSPRGIRGGGCAGLLTGALNLLVLGSLLRGDQPGQLARSAAVWIPGSLILSAALAALGAALGRRVRRPLGAGWAAAFAGVAALATLLLLVVGGSVTGTDSGLAVVDWPNTEGYNMFLFPLARMTGGIYFEHSHRLIGSLVGLTTLVLAIYIQATERRGWLRTLAWVALAAVILQGVLGGLRVTGRFTLSTAPEDTAPNIALAILHGVLGQMFFGLLVAISVLLLPAWSRTCQLVPARGASTDRGLGVLLVVLLLCQLVVGALVRHFTWALQVLPSGLQTPPAELVQRGAAALHLHITLAVGVVIAASAAGLRAWGLYGTTPVLRRLGLALLAGVGVQVVLGILALLVSGNDSWTNRPRTLDVIITTTHQTTGALLLALSVALTLWNYRLLHAPAEEAPAAQRGNGVAPLTSRAARDKARATAAD